MRSRRLCWLFALLIGACAAIIMTYIVVVNERPRYRFAELLTKDSGIELESLVITGQNRRVVIADSPSLQYITGLFGSCRHDGYVPSRVGTTYSGTLILRNGQSFAIGLYIPSARDGITVSYPLDTLGDPLYYWLEFDEKVPGPLMAAVEEIR